MDVNGISEWRGAFREGEGTISTGSPTLRESPYTFASRFEGAPGACPEELLAAAHAGCINHAIANILGHSGKRADHIRTVATVTMGRDAEGFPAVLRIRFEVEARVEGLDADAFRDVAEFAMRGCAISKALRVEMTVSAQLIAKQQLTP
jgi:osmotically inducible protein OsmC